MSDIYFSVVIPSYNQREFLKQAINSVFNQRYNLFEIIVIDNKSNDGTQEYIRSLKSNKTHSREYTTHDSYMPSLKNQSASDKILCYDVEFEKVEDIDVSTIEKYVPLQRLS